MSQRKSSPGGKKKRRWSIRRTLTLSAAVVTLIGGIFAIAYEPPIHTFLFGRNQKVSGTNIHVLRLLSDDGSLLPIYRVSTRYTGGNCIESEVSSDPQALKCFENQAILDPCWIGGPKMDCVATPWTQDVAEVSGATVTRGPLKTSLRPEPWALKIVNPENSSQRLYCLFEGGANGVIDGQRVNWSCRRDKSMASPTVGEALGIPTEQQGLPWSVFYFASASNNVAPATITDAWR